MPPDRVGIEASTLHGKRSVAVAGPDVEPTTATGRGTMWIREAGGRATSQERASHRSRRRARSVGCCRVVFGTPVGARQWVAESANPGSMNRDKTQEDPSERGGEFEGRIVFNLGVTPVRRTSSSGHAKTVPKTIGTT